MDILKIDSPFNKDKFLKENTLRLKLLKKPLIRQVIGWTITTTLLLITTLLLYFSGEQYIPFLIVTSIFGFVAFFISQVLVASKKKFKIKIRDLAEKYEKEKINGVYEINADGINYTDKEKTFNLKWTVFRYFIIYNGYLIIATGETVENALFFTRQEMGSDIWDAFVSILKTNIPQRTIK